ncbi:transporter substrate-binding domain-containing protein [Roseobacter sp. GAI101]|uniref:transporter substrate-binding domain-containing protein n=1 Tax=Roseobacter sp. (strain GAI101) TaxID=391589 RepID=UPI00018723D1|nr:transporter substrate-binding domain-containing protein [Roseobacter sp. GAI101]EEB82388.1 arginine-binding periplasmic protein 1 [Roseobacter sp. GAI101]
MRTLISSALLALLATTASAEDLRIGTSADYPPWEAVDANNEIFGFDRDIGDEICKRIAATCTWQNQSFDGLLPGLQVGRFDVIISGISINEERSKSVDFSAPYADAPNSFIVLADNPAAAAKSKEDLIAALSSGVIGAQGGTTHEQVIRAHFANANVRLYERPDQVMSDILSGRIDAGVMERSAAEPLMDSEKGGVLVYAGPKLTGVDFEEFGKGQAVALAKGNTVLQNRVNDAVAEMLKDGTIKTISEKWFGYDQSPK